MKLISFAVGVAQSYGIVVDGGVIDAGKQLRDRHPTLQSALADVTCLRALATREPDFPLDSIALAPPVPNPGRILCVGLNYKSHIAETGRPTPTHPMLFPRYPDTLVAHAEALVRPTASSQFDFEGELAFVIGRGGRHIRADAAEDHVAGYACFNDGSVRDFQRHTTQFLPGKNFWRSGSFGPWLVTPDETGPVENLGLVTRLNGEEVQRARLDDLLFGVPELIAYVSTFMPLLPGDVIATGTTGGVGIFRTPPLWMKAGDRVEVEIEKIGILSNPVVDEGSLQGAARASSPEACTRRHPRQSDDAERDSLRR